MRRSRKGRILSPRSMASPQWTLSMTSNAIQAGMLLWTHGVPPLKSSSVKLRSRYFACLSGRALKAGRRAEAAGRKSPKIARQGHGYNSSTARTSRAGKRIPVSRETWRVEKGVLIGSGKDENLFTERGDFENFHLRTRSTCERPRHRRHLFPGVNSICSFANCRSVWPPGGIRARISGKRSHGTPFIRAVFLIPSDMDTRQRLIWTRKPVSQRTTS